MNLSLSSNLWQLDKQYEHIPRIPTFLFFALWFVPCLYFSIQTLFLHSKLQHYLQAKDAFKIFQKYLKVTSKLLLILPNTEFRFQRLKMLPIHLRDQFAKFYLIAI